MPEAARNLNTDERLAYILQMLIELSAIARARQYTMLEYLISMAIAEASDVLRGVRPTTPLPPRD